MFYSVFVLGKKGPLARVWLAAHWDKKITKSQIQETNIVESVDSILQPRIKLSLRTSSHLLLGIVRIYARKTVYLLQDCQDAAYKIRSAFRPGAVDLPEGKQEAAVTAITLPEMLDFVANFDLIEPPALIDPVVNTTNHRNITLSEDVAMADDTFMSDYQWGNHCEVSTARNISNVSGAKALQQLDANVNDDGFGGELGAPPLPDDEFFQVDIDANGAPKLSEDPVENELAHEEDRPMSRASVASDMSAAPSMADSGPPSTPGGMGAFDNADIDNVQGPFDSMRDLPMDMGPDLSGAGENLLNNVADDVRTNGNLPTIPEEDRPESAANQPADQNQLPDSMVLDPVVQDGHGLAPRRKRRKKLGITVDDIKTLSGEEIKAQLSDTKDIVTALDLAPPSKQLMEVKRSANVDKLFSMPECHILSKILIEHYSRNLISSKLDHDAAEGELPSVARPDSFVNNTLNGHNMDSFAAPSFGFEGDLPGQMPEVSYLESSDFGTDLLPPKTPKTPAAYRENTTQQQNRTSPKKKRARTEPEQPSEKQKSPTKKLSQQRTASPLPFETQGSDLDDIRDQNSDLFQQPAAYNNEEEEDDGPVEDAMNVGETEEQYEERIRNRRTHILLQLMAQRLNDGTLQFSNLCRNYRRKQVAQHFFSLLVLKKQQAVSLCQADTGDSYGEISITKGPRYVEFVPSD